jgi:DNA-binding XRE family transcriptional regulator
MPSTWKYRELHDLVTSRPGADRRLAAQRKESLAEIGLFELRRALDRSQTEVGIELGISQSAISQLERGGDMKLSTLRKYLEQLGARLELLAVFEDDDEVHVIPIRTGETMA